MTKRAGEFIVHASNENSDTAYTSVRFGNVLGSAGSVIPTFKAQIENGGPVTVTDPNMERYFMTIPEAVQLVIQTGAFDGRGETFILDMGRPIKVAKLAEDIIKLSGFSAGFLTVKLNIARLDILKISPRMLIISPVAILFAF